MGEKKSRDDKVEENLERLVQSQRPLYCKYCRGNMVFAGGGLYRCEECGYETLDDFGKVKQYLEEHGTSKIWAISEATGVRERTIKVFLRQGRVQIPEGSDCYIKCEKCGCNIKFGRFCPDCVRKLSGGIHSKFVEEMGEKPRVVKESDKGKMYFLNRDHR